MPFEKDCGDDGDRSCDGEGDDGDLGGCDYR